MNIEDDQECIKVLVADDDSAVLECYREAFVDTNEMDQEQALDALAAELFETSSKLKNQPKFKTVFCNQGADAIRMAEAARMEGNPFDVVILDVRMPPGIDGVKQVARYGDMIPMLKLYSLPASPIFPLKNYSVAFLLIFQRQAEITLYRIRLLYCTGIVQYKLPS